MADQHDCIVVGAGPAGLLAGVTLKEAGRDVVVVEARDRIGGRAHSVSASDGSAVERGAQNLHGPTVATWEFVTKFGLQTHYLEPRNQGVPAFRGGEWLLDGDPIIYDAHERVDEVFGVPNSDDVSLHDALVTAGLRGAELEAAELMMSVSVPVPPEEASARNAAEIHHIGDSMRDPLSGVSRPGNANFMLVDGYRRLWKELSSSIADLIQYSAPVTAIDWSPGNVTLHTPGQELRARSAILTVPVGVLQADTITFDPVLPERKNAAIQGIRRGGLIKMVAEFHRAWWEDSLGPVRSVRSFQRAGPGAFRGFSAPFSNRPGPPTLMSIMGTPYVDEFTGDSGRIRSLFLEALGEMFPGVELEPEIVNLDIADWASDPWTMGGVSVVPVGSYKLRADLAAPTPPLFWAGEAAHTHGHAECVHGALETGRRAAIEAMHCLQPMYANRSDDRLDWWQYSPQMR